VVHLIVKVATGEVTCTEVAVAWTVSLTWVRTVIFWEKVTLPEASVVVLVVAVPVAVVTERWTALRAYALPSAVTA
jgi:hypothetical protein